MIKILLPHDFEKRKVIEKIYNDLANSIFQEGCLQDIEFKYKGKLQKFLSKEEVKKFLLSKDFYDYKFQYKSDFMRDLLELNSNVKISSLLNGKSNSEKVKEFLHKYDKFNYEEEYHSLYEFKQLNISNLKKQSTHPALCRYKSVCTIFDYGKLRSADRHTILNEIDMPVCPYCNIEYTINFNDNGIRKNMADIDHFYIKSEYPEYSLCLYNFIPSCPICNQKIKGKHSMTKETHIYPYNEEFGNECCFRIENLVDYWRADDSSNVRARIILFDSSGNDRVEQSISDFKLNERYDNFSYVVNDLIEKVRIYNETYVQSLDETFSGLIDRQMIKNLVFGTSLSPKEYGRKSLGKLTQDILVQLRIFPKS